MMKARAIIIGGGLAGLAAAAALAPRGWHVTLLEARKRLGGRASSFTDSATGDTIDACQHVSMGCCTAFRAFARSVGIDHLMRRQADLYFLTLDGKQTRWRADPLPAPLHLARSFLRAHFLTLREKTRIGLALAALRRLSPRVDGPLLPWLLGQGQSERMIEQFWNVVLVSALNARVEHAGLKYARKVFVDAFLTQRDGGTVEIPTVPLARLYGQELNAWLRRHHVTVRLETTVRRVLVEQDEARGVELRSGEVLTAEAYVLAAPWHRSANLLPEEIVEDEPLLANLSQLEPSPITSVHLWHDRPLTALPHAVLLGGVGQWYFNRGETGEGKFYSQVVISASDSLGASSHQAIQEAVAHELAEYFPKADARLLRARVLTEVNATFRPAPGVDAWRPGQTTSIRRLFLAGDWTQTGWPATMEGAVRSGRLAAAAVERGVWQ